MKVLYSLGKKNNYAFRCAGGIRMYGTILPPGAFRGLVTPPLHWYIGTGKQG